MSYASSRTSTTIPINCLSSANVGSIFTATQDSGIILPLTLVTATDTTLASLSLPLGTWTGYVQINISGGATTNIDYFNIYEDDGVLVKTSSYLVNTILPNASIFSFKFPMTITTFGTTTNQPVISVEGVFTGAAALTVRAVSVYLTKVV